jgi:hypothetical protein
MSELKVFNSRNNITLLKEVIHHRCSNEPAIKLDTSHNKLLHKLMNYVLSNVSPTIPQGHTEMSYTKLMNNKVLNLFISNVRGSSDEQYIHSEVNSQSASNSIQQERHRTDIVFDSVLDKQNNMPSAFMPPPQIQSHEQPMGSNISASGVEDQLKHIQTARSELEPKQHTNNIDFTIEKREEEPLVNSTEQTQLYNELIQQRGISTNGDMSSGVENSISGIKPDNSYLSPPADNSLMLLNNNMGFTDNNMPATDNTVSHLYNENGEYKDEEYNSTDVIMSNNTIETDDIMANDNMMSNNHLFTKINNVMDGVIVDNGGVNNTEINHRLQNNIDGIDLNRNNRDLIIKESDDPKNLFYQKDKELEDELNRINMKSLNDHYESPVILPRNIKTYNDDFYITIDSRDRNLEIYPSPSSFQVKFSPASDSIERQQQLDSNNNIIYESTVKYIGNPAGAGISRTYSNILEMKLLHCIVPLGVKWICGNSPSDYYDGACTGSENNGLCIPYGPKYSSDTGIAVSVLNEPYLLLNIDELEGPYEGTNDANSKAFAKLILSSDWKRDYFFSQISSFVYMGTAGNETYKYRPTNLGTIDKMTMNLKRHDGDLYSFGDDKLYVKYICKGNENKKTGKNNVKIVVQGTHKDYIDCSITDIGIVPGELLYFYDTRPTEAHMIKFHRDLHITCMTVLKKKELNKYSLGVGKKNTKTNDTTLDNTICSNSVKTDNNFKRVDKKQKYIKINASIVKINNLTDEQSDIEKLGIDCEKKEYKVDFSKFLAIGNYLGIVYKTSSGEVHSELLKVYCVDRYDVIVMKPTNYTDGDEILKFGFAENYNRGSTSTDKNSLFSRGGKRACCVKKNCCPGGECGGGEGDCGVCNSGDEELSFEIDFPYDKLPDYIQKCAYFENEIFFIQQKLQVSYTMKLTEVRKEDANFRSLLVKNG